MSQITIEQLSQKDIKKFLKFAFTIYKDNPNWVPPLFMDKMKLLNKNKNPFFLKKIRIYLDYNVLELR